MNTSNHQGFTHEPRHSEQIEWYTPPHIFQAIGLTFDIDVCSAGLGNDHVPANTRFTKEDNGLLQPWHGLVWCNPPYGRAIKNWIRKGYESSQQGATVVMLIPARTDTSYWHDYVMRGDIRFLRGRIKFVQPDGTATHPAPFPSAIVIFKKEENNGN